MSKKKKKTLYDLQKALRVIAQDYFKKWKESLALWSENKNKRGCGLRVV